MNLNLLKICIRGPNNWIGQRWCLIDFIMPNTKEANKFWTTKRYWHSWLRLVWLVFTSPHDTFLSLSLSLYYSVFLYLLACSILGWALLCLALKVFLFFFIWGMWVHFFFYLRLLFCFFLLFSHGKEEFCCSNSKPIKIC